MPAGPVQVAAVVPLVQNQQIQVQVHVPAPAPLPPVPPAVLPPVPPAVLPVVALVVPASMWSWYWHTGRRLVSLPRLEI